jgi:16S rRNA processing protein RimM
VTVVPGDPAWFAVGSILHSGEETLVVAGSRPYRDRGLVVRFEGVADRAAAESLRGRVVYADAGRARLLEPGEFWLTDLIGLEAVDPAGHTLGVVSAVVAGPQDRLVVETLPGRKVEVPFVADLVGDPEGGRIVIDAPPGLFDEGG